MIPDFTPYVVVLALALALLWASVRVLREYERAVVFTLGRFSGVRGPGLILLVPVVQQMQRVGLRTNVLDVPSQDVISRDNVSVKVNAVVYFRVIDADRAVIEVDFLEEAVDRLSANGRRQGAARRGIAKISAQRQFFAKRAGIRRIDRGPLIAMMARCTRQPSPCCHDRASGTAIMTAPAARLS